MKKVLFILALIGVTAFSFPDTSYNQYIWEEFYQLSEANKQVDFEHPDLALLDACIFFATNEQRELKNKSAFTFSASLRNAADFHTQEMITKNFFNHINPKNPPYKTPTKRLDKFGARFNTYGENIAYYSSEETTYL